MNGTAANLYKPLFQILHWGPLMLNLMRSCGDAFSHYDPKSWNILPITFIFIHLQHFIIQSNLQMRKAASDFIIKANIFAAHKE